MWPFNRKQTLAESGFFRGFVDWHCHLLPAADDGVQTLEETLQILAEYERFQVRAVWLTPHVMEDLPHTPACLRERFAELKRAYQGTLSLHLAAEHMLDRLFAERLKQGEVLPIGFGKDHLLVETSYFNPPLDFDALLRQIQAAGYHPLLAHPERYAYMEARDYERLKARGVRFQLNLWSLGGGYGHAARRKAEYLLEKGYYEVAGTDLHRMSVWESLKTIRMGSEIRHTLPHPDGLQINS